MISVEEQIVSSSAQAAYKRGYATFTLFLVTRRG